MKKKSAHLILQSNQFHLAIDHQWIAYKELHELLDHCVQKKISQVSITINTPDQIFEHITLPDLQYMDRFIYQRQKLNQLKETGLFERIPSSNHKQIINYAGVIYTDHLKYLLQRLTDLQIHICRLQLFALEVGQLIPLKKTPHAWSIFCVEEKGFLYMSIFKGEDLIFYRHAPIDAWSQTLNYIRHHPLYYEEEIQIYTTNPQTQIQNAHVIDVKDIYAELLCKKPVVDLHKRQWQLHKLSHLAHIIAACIFFCITATYMVEFIQKRNIHAVLKNQYHQLQQIPKDALSSLSDAQLDLILIQLEKHEQDRFMMTLKQLQQAIRDCGQIIQYHASYQDHQPFVHQLKVQIGKCLPHPKQKQQIAYLIKKHLPHQVDIQWNKNGQLHITGLKP